MKFDSEIEENIINTGWLSKKEMMGSTIIVGVFSVLIAIFLFFVDFGVSQFISRLIGGN